LQVYSAAGKNVALGVKVTALDSIEGGRWSTRYLVDDYTSRHRLLGVNDLGVQKRIALELDLHRGETTRRRLFDMLIDADTRGELVHAAKEIETFNAQLATLQSSRRFTLPCDRAAGDPRIATRRCRTQGGVGGAWRV